MRPQPIFKSIISLLSLIILVANSVYGQVKNPSTDSLLVQLSNFPAPDSNRVLLLNQLAYASYYSDPIVSFRYGLEAKKISESIHFTRGQADACRQIGMAYWEQGNIPGALNYFLEGLRIAELNHHTQVEADITGNIGTAYNSMGNPQEALQFLIRARQMQRRLLNRLRESTVLNNIGDSYLALKQYDKATEAYSTALEYSLQHDYKLGVTTNLRNLGNVLEAKGNYDSALSNYIKCMHLSEEIRDHRGFILSHKSIASIYLHKHKLEDAKQYVQIALDAAYKVRLRAIIRDLYELMYKISEAENNKIKSFDYFRLYTTYKDSVQNLRIEAEVATQRLHFESGKKQAEIELLKKDGDLQRERIAIQNTQLVFAVLLVLLGALFLILIIRSYKKVKHKNILLAQKNEEVFQQQVQIRTQHDELLTLNEELKSQQEEVMSQRDALSEKNKEIELVNKEIAELNEKLEQQVMHRTELLERQNSKLSDYAFLNAHKLRAPLARIMGLVNLLLMRVDSKEKPVIMNHLSSSSDELHEVADSLSKAIQDELNPKAE